MGPIQGPTAPRHLSAIRLIGERSGHCAASDSRYGESQAPNHCGAVLGRDFAKSSLEDDVVECHKAGEAIGVGSKHLDGKLVQRLHLILSIGEGHAWQPMETGQTGASWQPDALSNGRETKHKKRIRLAHAGSELLGQLELVWQHLRFAHRSLA